MTPTPPPTFKPTLILHGGAGNIQRSTLPPSLYKQYQASLLTYLRSTKSLLETGSSALDAAVHAVSLMEDDELCNCGRGSVFTTAGTIEMEASVMVTSVNDDNTNASTNNTSGERLDSSDGSMKRGAGVIGLRNVRHPIRLAREVLLRTGQDRSGEPVDDGGAGGGNMHCQLSGEYVEKLARGWGVEFKPDEWFWTRRRWEEHRRGLEGRGRTSTTTTTTSTSTSTSSSSSSPGGGAGGGVLLDYEGGFGEEVTLSQGTVGCVCLDQWGNLAVATSTGGLTNKVPGRVGDTPTLGAGFWAESWEESSLPSGSGCGSGSGSSERSMGREMRYTRQSRDSFVVPGTVSIWDMTLRDCFGGPSVLRDLFGSEDVVQERSGSLPSYDLKQPLVNQDPFSPRYRGEEKKKRLAVAVSGTGNGDSFLRMAAARTACAMLRFSPHTPSLADVVRAVAGTGGEMQRSAGRRWGKTGEGMCGIIGIEAGVVDGEEGIGLRKGRVVFDFNCGGMWRAWVEEREDGRETERVMVFKDEYR